MRFTESCLKIVLLVATIRAFARHHLRRWSRPFTRMVAIINTEGKLPQAKCILPFSWIDSLIASRCLAHIEGIWIIVQSAAVIALTFIYLHTLGGQWQMVLGLEFSV